MAPQTPPHHNPAPKAVGAIEQSPGFLQIRHREGLADTATADSFGLVPQHGYHFHGNAVALSQAYEIVAIAAAFCPKSEVFTNCYPPGSELLPQHLLHKGFRAEAGQTQGERH